MKSEKYLFYPGIIRNKLVEISKSQAVDIRSVFKINPCFEEWVIYTYNPLKSQQVIVHNKVVVIDIITLVCINEDHVELVTGGG